MKELVVTVIIAFVLAFAISVKSTNEDAVVRDNIEALMDTKIITTIEPCAWQPSEECLFVYMYHDEYIIEPLSDHMKATR